MGLEKLPGVLQKPVLVLPENTAIGVQLATVLIFTPVTSLVD